MINILVLCTGNSCRSQMAEGFLREYFGNRATIYSAGLEAHGVNPRAIETMKEVCIDITAHQSNTIDDLPEISFNYVITVCDNAKEKCPYFPASTAILHQNFPDPAKASGSDSDIEIVFRECRKLIDDYCLELSNNLH